MAGSIYDQNYIRQCFDAWYLSGRPTAPRDIKSVIPVFEPTGKKPSPAQIRRWVVEGAWDVWADELDAKAMILLDDGLVNKKAEMLKRHQKDAEVLAKKALEHLRVDGFDSSSAAVSAYFKATEEQRKTAGFSDLLERLDKMTNNDVEKEIISKLNRIKENDQIIEIEPENIETEE
jgi:hypothetical protein